VNPGTATATVTTNPVTTGTFSPSGS
jgi:hypothetical protein